mmetsp:Transcript_80056/g.229781  ORF Transcript_80056/g.229781 Transcript_80056/m.229781 type:complete len:209 (+) Transcript_80056:385-1011(+)
MHLFLLLLLLLHRHSSERLCNSMMFQLRCSLTLSDEVLLSRHLPLANCRCWLLDLPRRKLASRLGIPIVFVLHRILALQHCISITFMLRRELDSWDGDPRCVHFDMADCILWVLLFLLYCELALHRCIFIDLHLHCKLAAILLRFQLCLANCFCWLLLIRCNVFVLLQSILAMWLCGERCLLLPHVPGTPLLLCVGDLDPMVRARVPT